MSNQRTAWRSSVLASAWVVVGMAACREAPPPTRAVDFALLQGWSYQAGLAGMPKGVAELDGRDVRLRGRAFPVESSTFLLVAADAPWVNVPCQDAPSVLSWVRVVVRASDLPPQGALVDCVGQFAVRENVVDGDCLDVYSLAATSVRIQ